MLSGMSTLSVDDNASSSSSSSVLGSNSRLKIPGLFLKRGSWLLKDHEYDYISLGDESVPPFKTLNFAGEDKRILKSCNGLLLCSNWDGSGLTYLNYYIYNPFTKQHKTLPPFIPPAYIPCSWSLLRSLKDIELAFDPLKSPYYKVICIWGNHGGSAEKRIEIYSSETSSWRVCEKEYTFPDAYKSCVLWNGSLNWITNDGTLIYFDVEEEKLGAVSCPWKKDSSWYTGLNCLHVSGDHLLLLLSNHDLSTCFDVMGMDTNYAGWIMKYKVDMEGLKGSYPELGNPFGYEVIFIDEVEENNSPKFIVLIYESDVVISYDSGRNSCTKLYDLAPQQQSLKGFNSVYKHIESLACV